MHDCSLVHTATNNVDQYGNQSNDTKHTRRAELLLCNFDASACGWRARFEHVCAFVWTVNERDGHLLSKRIAVAEQADDRVLSSHRTVVCRFLRFALLVILVVIVIIDNFPGSKIFGVASGAWRRTW